MAKGTPPPPSSCSGAEQAQVAQERNAHNRLQRKGSALGKGHGEGDASCLDANNLRNKPLVRGPLGGAWRGGGGPGGLATWGGGGV